MQRIHLNKPSWIHVHKPDWHLFGIRLEHLIHDPRFWAALALVILFGLMIITAILAEPTGGPTVPRMPVYPYMP